jgi:biopolymer transport protein ExbD
VGYGEFSNFVTIALQGSQAMPLKTHHDEQLSLNLTPMIDVVFLLIIFFMVGTKFAELERKIAVKVPEVADGGTLSPAPEKRIVTVARDGQIALDNQVLTLPQLVEQLSAARTQAADLGVIVRGDAEGAFQNVAQVLNAVRKAGIKEMGISVKLAKE